MRPRANGSATPRGPDAPAGSIAHRWAPGPGASRRAGSGAPPSTHARRRPWTTACPATGRGYLVIGSDGSSALVTLVERRSRFVLVHRPGHDRTGATVAAAAMIADPPGAVWRTVTWDQGRETARHREVTGATGARFHFADAHSPWQRGTNENTNGLIRHHFPEKTRFCDVTDTRVRAVQDELNTRPRIVLHGRTPAETTNDIINDANTP